MDAALLGPLAALLSSITWVFGSSAYTHLSRRYAPAAINFNRALLGMGVFLAMIALDFAGVRASAVAIASELPSRMAWLTTSIVASYVVGDGLFLWSALSIGFPAAQGIGAIYPLWATLAAVVLYGEPLGGLRMLGIVLAICGVVVVLLSGKDARAELPPPHLSFLKKRKVGVALALCTSFLWALNSFAVSKGGVGVHPALANVFRMSLAMLLCPIMARVQTGAAPRLRLERADYRRFGVVIALEAGLGSSLYVYGLSHSPVAVGSTLSSLAPVFSVPLAVALGWERFSLPKAAAIVVVVCGLALLVQPPG